MHSSEEKREYNFIRQKILSKAILKWMQRQKGRMLVNNRQILDFMGVQGV